MNDTVLNLSLKLSAALNVPAPPLSRPHTIATIPNGGFAISDEFNHRVIIVDGEGKFIHAFGSKGHEKGQFWYPRGVALDSDSSIIVCDAWNHRIQRFTIGGEFISSFGAIGDGAGQFNEPVSAAPDVDGIWILDRCNNKIKKLSRDGAPISSFGSQMSSANELSANKPARVLFSGEPRTSGFLFPCGFARTQGGAFAIADTGNRRIAIISSAGETLSVIKLDVKGEGQRRYPVSISIVSGDYAIISFIDGSCRLIDLFKPWKAADLSLRGEAGAPPCFAVSGSSIIAFNPAKQAFDFYEFPDLDSFFANAEPSPIPESAQPGAVLNEWTEFERSKWAEWLKSAPESESTAARAKSFVKACADSAKNAAKSLNEIEGEMAKLIVSFHEKGEEANAARLNGQNSAPFVNEKHWSQLRYKLENMKRLEAVWAMQEDLAAAIDTLRLPWTEKALTEERSSFAAMLRSEYDQRVADYSFIGGWMADRFADPANVNLSAVAHAFSVAGFLETHLDYLRRAIKLLDPAGAALKRPDYESTIETEMVNYSDDPIAGTAGLLVLSAQVCSSLGLASTAAALLGAGLNRQDSGYADYAAMLFDVADFDGKSGDALLLPAASAISAVQEPYQAAEIALRLQTGGDIVKAGGLIEKYSRAWAASPSLAVKGKAISRRQEILESKPKSVTLAKNQINPDSSLRYLGSVRIRHPKEKRFILPWLLLPLSENKIVVGDLWNRELFICEKSGEDITAKEAVEAPFLAISISKTPDGKALLIHRPAPERPWDGLRILTLDPATLAMEDISAKISDLLPLAPVRAYHAPGGELCVYDYINSEWRVINSALTLVETSYKPAKQYQSIEPNGKGFIGSVTEDDEAHLYSADGGLLRIIRGGPLMGPTGVFSSGGGLLMLSTPVGLLVYGEDGSFQYRVGELSGGGATMRLDERIYGVSAGGGFGGASVLAADKKYHAIHLFGF